MVVTSFPATLSAIKYLVYTEVPDQERFALSWKWLVSWGFMLLYFIVYPSFLIWGFAKGKRRAWWDALAFLITIHTLALLLDVDGLLQFNRLVFGFDASRFVRFLFQSSVFIIYPYFHDLVLNRFEIDMLYIRANIPKLIIKFSLNLILFLVWLRWTMNIGRSLTTLVPLELG